ncbi:endolytic transglycosylase MltG [Streptomyces uncialis]|uniref:Endolytic murein transglycosylase n=1 Tax=Streptomyces uncialis TaxID=1048205 RepID=A0A1Q4V449_9ACTN|nr:endolytic transglycosylase MltG [Streptomyces uncialis]OKH92500.1 hypothetical protein AB852_22800 [Streptomyces uncialis]
MTEYGRGQGSEPWYPEDPLYGDVGWEGSQGHPGQSPQTGQQYPHGQQHQQQGHQDQHQQHQQGQQHQYYEQGQPQQSYPQDQGQGQGQGYDPQQYPQDHTQQGYPQQGHAPQHAGQSPQYDEWHNQPAPGQGDAHGGQYQGGWEAAQPGQIPYGTDPAGTYAGQPEAYGAEQPDHYGSDAAYPPPEPPGRRRAAPDPDEATEWDAGQEGEDHAFFTGQDAPDGDGYDDEEPEGRSGGRGGDRRGRGGKSRKGRSGVACLLVTAVFAGGIGAVGYFGFQFYQDRFGTAPDFAGDGTGETVSVDIPKGSLGSGIGQKLKEAGVIRSVDAFVSAQQQNPKGNTIQDGVYLLRKQMSAASAVELMLSPKSRNNLIIAEGRRNAWVYSQIDKRLELPGGTTKEVALKESKSLGLPSWANADKDIKDPLEGFLYPSSYSVAKGMKPAAVLKKMVARAVEQYETYDLEAKARELGLKDPLEVVTVASMVQAEGMTHDDFKKMAAVVYNRLKPTNVVTNQKVEFDSAYNYVKNQSEIDISTKEIRNYDDPYNTYFYAGLPPGPIGNPGKDAMQAAVEPDTDGWMFFISIDGKTTTFTKELADHEELVREFNERRKNGD